MCAALEDGNLMYLTEDGKLMYLTPIFGNLRPKKAANKRRILVW